MKEPVLWHNNDQLSSEKITIFTKNKDIDHIELDELAFYYIPGRLDTI